MMVGIHISQEIFAVDVLTALKLCLEHGSQAYCATVTTIKEISLMPGFD